MAEMKELGSRAIAEQREKHGKDVIAKILVSKGLDAKKAQETAQEIVAAGFCIVGGGVPI